VIEHNLDVIKTADWIVDLGPEGGARGGEIVVAGTPEQVAATERSATGQYLARVLRGEPLLPLSDVTFAEAAGRPAPGTDTRNGRSSRPRPKVTAAAGTTT
jgi:excinuclease ABC subunit A